MTCSIIYNAYKVDKNLSSLKPRKREKMVSQDPKQKIKTITTNLLAEQRRPGGHGSGTISDSMEKTIMVLSTAHMSYALVCLTTNLALTLTVQAITFGPSSQFCYDDNISPGSPNFSMCSLFKICGPTLS